MAQQQIITKPYVEELQDNDSLFINHDGALRQIKKSSADFASGADMRAEVAAREAFEAQELAAREAFEKNETEARKQFETSVGEQIAEKANIDGYYEEMTVGDAEQLVATQFVEDNEPYLFRSTGGSSDVGNRAYLDKIVGGTVAWNQLANKAVTSTAEVSNLGNGTKRISFTSALGRIGASCVAGNVIGMNAKANHKYLYWLDAFLETATHLAPQAFANTAVTVHAQKVISSVGVWDRAYCIFSSTIEQNVLPQFHNHTTENLPHNFLIKDYSVPIPVFDLTQMFGAGNEPTAEQFERMFPKDYYPYNAGELISVEGLQSRDTVGFNQWDEEWEVGILSWDGQPHPGVTDKIRSKNFIPCLPNATYGVASSANLQLFFYGENQNLVSYPEASNPNGSTFTTPSNARYMKFYTYLVYGTTYKHDICINLSSPSRNGEYEPYKKHSYPLDSSLTLRGIPKLDESNNLYYDGDEYTSDGKVKRKYGVIDLGTISWSKGGSNNKTSWVPVSWRTNVKPVQNTANLAHIMCNKYYTDTAENVERQANDKTIAVNKAAWVYIYDSAYVNATPQEFQTAMSGVMLVYELATPTTETAKPFQHIQIVDDFGTEEFVSTGIVPVGHNTRYPANLRDKLQHLPSLASADGTYMIQQSGKQMSLVHMPAVFPDTPTEDGTYTLKTVVTGGVTTLQWVAE